MTVPGDTSTTDCSIEPVGQSDLADVLTLMRAYCDFYNTTPSDQALIDLATALVADPDHEGRQFIARDSFGRPVGFATVFWTWSTTSACRIGVMNDLFVSERARGRRLAGALIAACRSECSRRGARRLTWQTATDNIRAQSVYERIGAIREQWIDYWLDA